MCKYQARWSLCVTLILWFFVITWLAMVRMVCVFTRSHAICKQNSQVWYAKGHSKARQKRIRMFCESTLHSNTRQIDRKLHGNSLDEYQMRCTVMILGKYYDLCICCNMRENIDLWRSKSYSATDLRVQQQSGCSNKRQLFCSKRIIRAMEFCQIIFSRAIKGLHKLTRLPFYSVMQY